VLNGAIDMAGSDRGNMRCFEAMGCGALLVSDAGLYPPGMEAGTTMATYESAGDAVELISKCLDHWSNSAEMAARGRSQVVQIYSKPLQWKQFTDLVARI
jgi:spore maturation protein CgeB